MDRVTMACATIPINSANTIVFPSVRTRDEDRAVADRDQNSLMLVGGIGRGHHCALRQGPGGALFKGFRIGGIKEMATALTSLARNVS